MTVPLSLASTNGSLPSTKSQGSITIDGQALLMALGRPPDIQTFGDYAIAFANTVQDHVRGYCKANIQSNICTFCTNLTNASANLAHLKFGLDGIRTHDLCLQLGVWEIWQRIA